MPAVGSELEFKREALIRSASKDCYNGARSEVKECVQEEGSLIWDACRDDILMAAVGSGLECKRGALIQRACKDSTMVAVV